MPSRIIGRLGCVATLGFVLSPRVAAHAQAASFTGIVTRDTLDHRLAGAEITIDSLHRGTTSNYQGEFRLSGLPAGRYVVIVRHVGYLPRVDTVEFKSDGRVEREFVLAPSSVTLDSMRVTAAERKNISPGLAGFEERRRLGFGRFVPDSVLRRHDNDRLTTIMRMMPGVNLVPYRSGNYAASTRSVGAPSVYVNPSDRNSPKGCWSTIYLDGAMLYSIVAGGRGEPVPDYNGFSVSMLAGVEYYNSSASIPSQYTSTEYGCGTILLWTRER